MKSVVVAILVIVTLGLTSTAVVAQQDADVYPDAEWCLLFMPEGGDIDYCVAKVGELLGDPATRKVPESLTRRFPAGSGMSAAEWTQYVQGALINLQSMVGSRGTNEETGLKAWRLTVDVFNNWLDAQDEWLAEHPVPTPCFEADYLKWVGALADFKDAMTSAEVGFDDFDETAVRIAASASIPALDKLLAVRDNPSDCDA